MERWRSRNLRIGQIAYDSGYDYSSIEIETYTQATRQLVERLENEWLFLQPRSKSDSDPDFWREVSQRWPLITTHIRISAELLVRAAWNNDRLGFDEYLEHFLLWPGGTRHPDYAPDWPFVISILSSELTNAPWTEVRSAVATRFPEYAEELDARSLYESMIGRLKSEVKMLSSLLSLSWWIRSRADSHALEYSKSILLSQAPSEEGDPLLHEADHRLFEKVFESWLESSRLESALGERYKQSILDGLVEKLDRMTERPVKSGRVYSPSTAHSRNDLRNSFQVLLLAFFDEAVLSRMKGTVYALVRRSFSSPSSGEFIEHLKGSLRNLAIEPGPTRERLEQAVLSFNPNSEYEQNWMIWSRFIGETLSEIDLLVTEHLSTRTLSSQFFEKLAADLHRKLIQSTDKMYLFHEFSIRTTGLKKSANTFRLTGVDKGFVVDPPLRSGSEMYSEGIVGQMVQVFSRMVLLDFWRLDREVKHLDSGPDSSEFWNQLKQLASGIPSASIVLSREDYSQYVMRRIENRSENLTEPRIRKSEKVGNGYVQTIEGIDVYVAGQERGRAILFSSTGLEQVVYSIQQNGLAVEARPKDVSSDDSNITIEFLFKQETDWRPIPSIEVVFPPSAEAVPSDF